MSTTRAIPTPLGSATSRVVSWVIVKTNTRSKKSSIVDTRTSSMARDGRLLDPAGGQPGCSANLSGRVLEAAAAALTGDVPLRRSRWDWGRKEDGRDYPLPGHRRRWWVGPVGARVRSLPWPSHHRRRAARDDRSSGGPVAVALVGPAHRGRVHRRPALHRVVDPRLRPALQAPHRRRTDDRP